jgi:hypothetical protein
MLAPRRGLVLAPTALIAVGAASFEPLRSRLGHAAAGLRELERLQLALAGICLLGMLVATAGCWRSALARSGARVGPLDACARYGVGSLVNAAMPARLGDGVRVALFARARGVSGCRSAAGVYAAVGVAGGLSSALVLVVGGVAAASPPIAGLGALLMVLLAGAAFAARRVLPGRRPLPQLGREGWLCLLAWALAGAVARLAALASIVGAAGLPSPLGAAPVRQPSLDLAATLPLTPGNIGLSSAAAALALRSRGVDTTHALSIGLALDAVQTLVSVVFGGCGLIVLALARRRDSRPALAGPPPRTAGPRDRSRSSPRLRRRGSGRTGSRLGGRRARYGRLAHAPIHTRGELRRSRR